MLLRVFKSGLFAALSAFGVIVLIAAAWIGWLAWWMGRQRGSGIGAVAGGTGPLLLAAVVLFALFFLYFWRRAGR